MVAANYAEFFPRILGPVSRHQPSIAVTRSPKASPAMRSGDRRDDFYSDLQRFLMLFNIKREYKVLLEAEATRSRTPQPWIQSVST